MASSDEPRADEGHVAQLPPTLEARRILVIDDEDDIRDVICEILRDEGFEAVGVRDGEAGLASAIESPPSLVICDLKMPGLDGREVLAKLRALDATAQTPFIFLSVTAGPKDVRSGMNLGADDFLAKPVAVDDLVAAVNARLRRLAPVTSPRRHGPRTVIADRYLLGAQVGHGGMGDVYRARDLLEDQEVAIKLVPAAGRSRERFLRECEVLSKLHHPRVVRYRDHGAVDAGELFLVMDLLDGVDLGVRISHGPLGVDDSLRVFHHAAEALAVAHAMGVVHRDVKPSNMLLVGGAIDALTLLDFGIARAPDARDITFEGEFLGTPGFVAPEQVMSRATEPDPRSDLFGLACTVWACLTGASPFRGPNPIAAMFLPGADTPPSIRAARPEVPAAVDALLARLLERDPERRLPDGAAVLDALRAIEPSTA
jgi:CheY-like chemotaxis protein